MTIVLAVIAVLIIAAIAFIINVALANHRRAQQDTAHSRKLNASDMYKNGEE